MGVQIKKTKASASSPESIERISARLKTSAIERVPLSAIQPNPRNSKKHPARKARLLAANILEFGFTSPILVDKDGVILAGHARYTAARRLGLPEIPIIRLAYLSPEQARCLAIADNKLAELGRWDFDQLAVELGELSDAKLDLTFDVELTGFETIDIDQIVKPKGRKAADESEFDRLPAPGPLISQPRDVWVCGDHVLCCGDPADPHLYEVVLEAERASVALGSCVPANLASQTRREVFGTTCGLMGSHMQPGGAVYYFVPWDQLEFLLAAAEPTFGKPIEMIVWADAKGTRGPIYQAHHEFVAMYVAGNVPSLHEGQLKKRGRHRANVWHYGVEGGTPGMKPIALIKDILHDCTRRGEIILDPCARAGATLIAAEQTGRRARMIEKAPTWCDLILQKYQELTGLSAKLAGTSEPFPEVAARRVKESNEGGCRE